MSRRDDDIRRASRRSNLRVVAAIGTAAIILGTFVVLREIAGPASTPTASPVAAASPSMAEPSPPRFECGLPSSLALTRHVSGTSLSISATNGTAGGSWTLLQSTNLALSLNQWQTNLTGNFDGNGHMSTNITNTATNHQQFYILKAP